MPRLLVLALALAACHSSSDAAVDAAPTPDAPPDAPPDASDAPVTFRYTPAWPGVMSVDVIGGFGQADDWTTPLATLAPSGGSFSATVTLPPGTYLYLFHVVGDAAAGAKASTTATFAIDPASEAFAACPTESPTYSANNPNPCAQLSVPQTAPALYHVTGTVVVDGAPVANHLVLLERDEPGSHHFFVNRATTGADGRYDLVAAAGTYRIQLRHPQFESKTDAQLAPASLGVLRRMISSPFAVSADVALAPAEVAFHDYAAFAPLTTATLPTTFSFGTSSGLPTRLEVYGTANAGAAPEIGDPWFSSPTTRTGSASFDGTFKTAQAREPAVVLDERYFWGVEQPHPADAAGILWTGQSMVVPLTWH